MKKSRRNARIYAFQFLFHLHMPEFLEMKTKLAQLSTKDVTFVEKISTFEASLSEEELLDGGIRDFAHSLMEGVLKNEEMLLLKIKENSLRWKVEHMMAVDVTLLKLAVYEMLLLKTPPKVVIDEYVELSKVYSSKESKDFINGILDGVIRSEKLSC